MNGSRRPAPLLWIALLLTVAAPVAINATSLYRLSVERLGLHGPVGFALPVTLDAAALVALVIRLRALRDGDAAAGASAAVTLFAGLSAVLAGIEGHAVGGAVGAVALGALPIVAVVMLSLTTSALRREDLRAAGLVSPRPPYFASLRWVLSPASTFRAWRHGILWEIPDRSMCLALTDPRAVTIVDVLDITHDDRVLSDVRRSPGRDVTPMSATSHPMDLHTSDLQAAVTQTETVTDTPEKPNPSTPPHVPSEWSGTKRGLVRDLVAAGYHDRVDIITECARLGVDVSIREVNRILADQATAGSRRL